MLKINKKLPLYISISLTLICFVGLIFLIFYMPVFADYLIGLPDNTGQREHLTETGRLLIHGAAYAILFLALLGDALLTVLLLKVRKNQVFTGNAVGLVHGISLCIIGMGVIFVLLCRFFTLSFFVGFAVIFLGLCVRVVKNVIEDAVSIKEENDFTV